MPLSVNKLVKLLSAKGFVPLRFYTLSGTCAFVEIISLKNGDTYMMYIPSKYEFDTSRYENNLKLKNIDIDDEDKKDINIPSEYAGEPEGLDVEEKYEGQISLDSEYPYSKKDSDDFKLEDKLVDHYRRPILLKDIDSQDNQDVKCIFRQLKRLKFCVQNLRYKLMIIYRRFLCVIHRQDYIECFFCKKLPLSNHRKLIITMDLELFYENYDTLYDDLTQVKTGIQRILDKNHVSHSKNLYAMLEKKSEIVRISEKLITKKEKLHKCILSFEILLERVTANQEQLLKDLQMVTNSKKQGIKYDIEGAHRKKKIEDELEKMEEIKDQIMNNIINTRAEDENLSLMIDKILFDNTIMLDKIFQNMVKLSTYAED